MSSSLPIAGPYRLGIEPTRRAVAASLFAALAMGLTMAETWATGSRPALADIATSAVTGATVFLAASLVVSSLADQAGSWWALLPLVVWAFGAAVQSRPAPILDGWDQACFGQCSARSMMLVLGIGATVELGLLAFATGRRAPASRAWRAGDALVSMAMASVLVVITIRTLEVIDGAPPATAWLAIVLAAFLSPVGRLHPLVNASLMALVASSVIPDLAEAIGDPSRAPLGEMTTYVAAVLGPLLIVGLAAASWSGWKRLLDMSARHPLPTLIALNVLNVADAVFTWSSIARDDASELNPVIETIGLPWKVAIVAVISGVVYRLRPRWLPYPAAALALVAAYHLSGLVING
jgi:hypothetical protein